MKVKIIQLVSGDMFIGGETNDKESDVVTLSRPKYFRFGPTQQGGIGIQMPDMLSIFTDDKEITFRSVAFSMTATEDVADSYRQSLSDILLPPTNKLELV